MRDRHRMLLTRRDILKAGGLTAVALGAGAAAGGPRLLDVLGRPASAVAADRPPDLKLVGTDGWISLPPSPSIFSQVARGRHPSRSATPPTAAARTSSGSRTRLGMSNVNQFELKNKAQHNAPLFWAKEGVEFRVQLTNVGLAQRPDLFDEHTVHWHGFKNVIPFFDGEPTGSISIPQGQTFTYVYLSHDPGTYMYHCHVEDTEHVHMGMTGLVFVRPAQDGNTALYPSGKYAYNDGDGSTGFDREYAMFLSEVWGDSHWADAHIQLPEWSDYRADFSLLNGRVYPETLLPNGSIAHNGTFVVARDANYDLLPPAGSPNLGNQPLSALDHLQRRRASPPPLREPRLHGGGDDARGHQDPGRRPRRDLHARPHWRRHRLRDQHPVVRGRRELRRDLQAPAAFRRDADPTSTSSSTGRTRAATTSSRDGGGQRTEVHVYPAGTLPPQAIPQPAPGRRGMSAAMSGATTMRGITHSRARIGLALAASSALAAGVLLPAAAGAGRRRRPARAPTGRASRARPTAAAARHPTFNLTTRAGYINLADGTTAYMWGYSEGGKPFQHPGPVLCVNGRRHRHGGPAQRVHDNVAEERAGRLDRVPRPGERPRRRRAVPARLRRRRRR